MRLIDENGKCSYRDEDTGDLKKSQVNELLESMTSLEGEICEINENDVMEDKINQNIVTDAIRPVSASFKQIRRNLIQQQLHVIFIHAKRFSGFLANTCLL